jgi:hypothetical protein
VKTSDMLAAAKLRLWVPKTKTEANRRSIASEWSICGSLTAATLPGAALPVRLEIHRRLGEHDTITEWLHAKGLVRRREVLNCSPTEIIQIQQFRLRWLEHLQAEYAAKGD